MAKRIAELQINKDGANLSSDDEQPSGIKLASADVMAKRKILKPKGRAFGGSAGPAVPSVPKFTGFGNSVASNSNDNDKADKLKALANKFVEAVNKANGSSDIPDFRDACEKYLEYYRKLGEVSLDNKSHTSSNSLSSGGSAQAPAVAKFSFGTTKAPSFTSTEDAAPTPKKPSSAQPAASNPFSGVSFGGQFTAPAPAATKPAAELDAPKNPFAGVAFTKPTPAETKATPALGSVSKPVAVDDSSDEEDSEEEKPKEIKIAGPSFSLATKPTIKNSPFSFGKKPQPKEPDSDSDSEIEIKGPTFTFNKTILDPVFNLKKADAEPTKPAQSTFGATATATPAAAPVFNFGQSKPSTNADSDSKPEEAAAAKPAFSFTGFGGSTGSNTESTKAAPFSFGSTAKTGEKPAPLFNFGAGAAVGTTENKTAETATGGAAAVPTSTKFLFGSAPSADSKPKFAFGSSSNGESKPAPFLFGTPASANSETKTTTSLFGGSEAKAPAFSFGTPSATFGAPSTTFGAPSAPFGISAPSASTNEESESKENEAEPDVNFAPVASLGDKKIETTSGEENETTVLQLRAKLMLYDVANKAEPYKTMGVGELKVLKAIEGKGSRILIRADGALRVLLNSALVKDLNYETMGNGSLVRIPSVDADGKIVTYVVKVKTADDGKKLAQVLNETK